MKKWESVRFLKSFHSLSLMIATKQKVYFIAIGLSVQVRSARGPQEVGS